MRSREQNDECIYLKTLKQTDPPKPGTKGEESALPRRRTSSAHAQLPFLIPKVESHANHLSPNSAHIGRRRPSYSPGPIRRIPSQGRYPLRPNSRGNVNPIEFEIKKKMKERRKACHDQTTSDSSARVDTEGFFSSLTSD